MDYYEFVCAGTPSMSVVTADPDPARIPDAAWVCCREWKYSRTFRLGDGSHDAAVDATIQARVAAEGYHILCKSPVNLLRVPAPRVGRSAATGS
jgi:hypothetical protein